MHTDRQRLQIMAAGIASLVLAIGVARFAYTPLLPLMQQQAGLGVAQAGWLAAINYAGYLSGALVAALVSDLQLKDRLYRLGMLVAVASTLLMGLSQDFALWALSRFVAGLASAAGMLLGTGLILNWLIRNEYRSELGLHFAGVGLGIAVVAAAVALLQPLLDWRAQWWVFALFGALLLWPALRWLPRPQEGVQTRSGQALTDDPPGRLFLWLFMAAYFCTGVGYVVSATFMVAIVDALPGLTGQGPLAFLVMGLAAAPASLVWDRVARRLGALDALVVAALLQIIGILLPLAGGLAAALLGAALFGGTFIGMVSLVLTMAGRYFPTRPAKMMGRMTLAYGAAQIVAPALTGTLALRYGGYGAGLYLAAAALALGMLLLLALRPLERRRARGAPLAPGSARG